MKVLVRVNEDGKAVYSPTDRKLMLEAIEKCKGGMAQITIKKFGNKRTTPQNAYYWAVPNKMITKHFNQEKTFDRNVSGQEVHDMLARKFLGTEIIELPTGDTVEVRKSTSELDKTGENAFFESFVDYVTVWAFDFLGLNIPPPQTKEDSTPFFAKAE